MSWFLTNLYPSMHPKDARIWDRRGSWSWGYRTLIELQFCVRTRATRFCCCAAVVDFFAKFFDFSGVKSMHQIPSAVLARFLLIMFLVSTRIGLSKTTFDILWINLVLISETFENFIFFAFFSSFDSQSVKKPARSLDVDKNQSE